EELGRLPGAAGSPLALGAAGARLVDPDGIVRRAALSALVRLAAGTAAAEGSLQHAMGCLGDPDDNVRVVALAAVAELAPSAGDERALDAVCPHLRDADDDVRKAAATALGKLGAQGDRARTGRHPQGPVKAKLYA
ncbi:unnamed protein product, partial [Prorocentrum cordatum]